MQAHWAWQLDIGFCVMSTACVCKTRVELEPKAIQAGAVWPGVRKNACIAFNQMHVFPRFAHR